jgi:peptidyl-prolyl cis-trans isomerase C
MKKTYWAGAIVAAALVLEGCGTTGSKSAASDKDAAAIPADAVAVVNGKPISKNALSSFIADLTKQNPEQQVPEGKAVESLINRELLRQEAERQNLQNNPTMQGRLENLTRDALAQAAVDNFRKGVVVTEDDARKEYDTKLAGADLTEYKARHILVETEDQAKDVLASLKKGAKFADLAKKFSKDPSAKQNGGDLGWFNPQQMVPEFAQAVASMKNGEISPSPVKTQFGWHIIQREDSRKGEPPPFDALKEQVRNMMIGQKVQQHVDALKNAAKIENRVSGDK